MGQLRECVGVCFKSFVSITIRLKWQSWTREERFVQAFFGLSAHLVGGKNSSHSFEGTGFGVSFSRRPKPGTDTGGRDSILQLFFGSRRRRRRGRPSSATTGRRRHSAGRVDGDGVAHRDVVAVVAADVVTVGGRDTDFFGGRFDQGLGWGWGQGTLTIYFAEIKMGPSGIREKKISDDRFTLGQYGTQVKTLQTTNAKEIQAKTK